MMFRQETHAKGSSIHLNGIMNRTKMKLGDIKLPLHFLGMTSVEPVEGE